MHIHQWWTSAEVKLLGTMPDVQLARRLGRSLSAVACKPPSWSFLKRRVEAGFSGLTRQLRYSTAVQWSKMADFRDPRTRKMAPESAFSVVQFLEKALC
jgi:hypothetical protein